MTINKEELYKLYMEWVNKVSEEFSLSRFEMNYLLNCNRGDALMILDQNHVAVEIVSSKTEHPLITTDPRETLK